MESTVQINGVKVVSFMNAAYFQLTIAMPEYSDSATLVCKSEFQCAMLFYGPDALPQCTITCPDKGLEKLIAERAAEIGLTLKNMVFLLALLCATQERFVLLQRSVWPAMHMGKETPPIKVALGWDADRQAWDCVFGDATKKIAEWHSYKVKRRFRPVAFFSSVNDFDANIKKICKAAEGA